MSTTFALIMDLWHHVGPGILFAFALPVFLMAFGLVVLTAFRRLRSRPEEA